MTSGPAPVRMYLSLELWDRLKAGTAQATEVPAPFDGLDVVPHPFVRDWVLVMSDGTVRVPGDKP